MEKNRESRITIISILLIICLWVFNAYSATFSEYEVKAAFIYNFTRFVEWPTNSFESTNSPIVIGILGKDPFGKILENVIKDETVKNRKLELKRYSKIEDITSNCHILFISKSEESKLPQILKYLEGKDVLTVGDFEGFAVGGGIIRLLTYEDKVKLRINLATAKRTNMVISSQILRAAEIIDEK
jgi:hypothetical protein